MKRSVGSLQGQRPALAESQQENGALRPPTARNLKELRKVFFPQHPSKSRDNWHLDFGLVEPGEKRSQKSQPGLLEDGR